MKVLYPLLFLSILLFLEACDGREVALPVDIPLESPKLFIRAILEQGTHPVVKLQKTRPVNDDFILDADVVNASILLFEDGQIIGEFVFASDTVRRYDLGFGASGGQDTVRIVEFINNYYTTQVALNLKKNATYHIVADAPGFPPLMSQPIVFRDEIQLLGAEAPAALIEYEGHYILRRLNVLLRKQGHPSDARSLFYCLPWYEDAGLRNVDIREGSTLSSSFAHDIPPVEQADVPVTATDLRFMDYYNENAAPDCLDDCYAPHEGVWMLVRTYKQEAVEYLDAVLENSEYIGGFFPPNPHFPHNVEGGYGIFSLVERDTIRIY